MVYILLKGWSSFIERDSLIQQNFGFRVDKAATEISCFPYHFSRSGWCSYDVMYRNLPHIKYGWVFYWSNKDAQMWYSYLLGWSHVLHISTEILYIYTHIYNHICSMCGTGTNIYLINDPNVDKYAIHGASGYGYIVFSCMCESWYIGRLWVQPYRIWTYIVDHMELTLVNHLTI